MEKNIKKKNVSVCVTDHFAVWQRLAQHCKSTFLQSKKKKKMSLLSRFFLLSLSLASKLYEGWFIVSCWTLYFQYLWIVLSKYFLNNEWWQLEKHYISQATSNVEMHCVLNDILHIIVWDAEYIFFILNSTVKKTQIHRFILKSELIPYYKFYCFCYVRSKLLGG